MQEGVYDAHVPISSQDNVIETQVSGQHLVNLRSNIRIINHLRTAAASLIIVLTVSWLILLHLFFCLFVSFFLYIYSCELISH